MGKVDDLRAMREARFAASARTVRGPATAKPSVAPAAAKPSVAEPPGSAGSTAPTRVPAKGGSGARAALFVVPTEAAAPAQPTVDPEPVVDLCGHRAISGKTCIRADSHAEKNHRYAKA